GGVGKKKVKTNCGVVVAAAVVLKGNDTDGGVVVTSVVSDERARTDGCVSIGVVIVECAITQCCVIGAGCQAEERIVPLSSVPAGIAAVRRRGDRFCRWRKRKADGYRYRGEYGISIFHRLTPLRLRFLELKFVI